LAFVEYQNNLVVKKEIGAGTVIIIKHKNWSSSAFYFAFRDVQFLISYGHGTMFVACCSDALPAEAERSIKNTISIIRFKSFGPVTGSYSLFLSNEIHV